MHRRETLSRHARPTRWSRPRASAVAALAAAGLAACAPNAGASFFPAPETGTDARSLVAEAPAGGLSRNVVLVSIDGLRPDAIEAFGATTLQRLMREGSYTLTATTISPSKTLPSHTSMLTGEDVDEHGVTWNSNQMDDHGHVDVPTIFEVARERGYRTAAFFSKTKFEHLQRAGSLDYTQAPRQGRLPFFGDKWPVSRTLGDVERYLGAGHAPNLLFVHIGEPDFAGHRSGWMSKPYGQAVRVADAAVARLVAAGDRAYGKGNWTLLVTADHGGHGRNHGSADPRDVTIPWIAWGKGVQASETPLAGTVRTFDTASTVLWVLGLQEPHDWRGTPVATAFATPANASVAAGAADR